MSTITTEFYYDVYGGITIDSPEDCLKRAQSIVDCCASYIPAEGAPEEIWYKKAVCAQAETIGLAGGVQGWLETGGADVSGVTLGSFSVQTKSGSGSGAGTGTAQASPCAGALMYLEKGGLLYRGTAVL